MAGHSRYSVDGSDEGEILKNKLSINDRVILEDAETLLLSDTYNYFFEILRNEKLKFTSKLLFSIHRYFLETLYDWAGKIRTVDISKNGVLFCAAPHIEKELADFDVSMKKVFPPEKCTKQEVSHILSIIHCELNAIHPFREGNGRTIRLFLDLMAASLGFDVIGFEKTSKENYIKACKLGMLREYGEMAKIIKKGLVRLS